MRSQFYESSMLRWGLWSLVLFVLAGPGGPSARGATLRWKFKPGETLHYTMDQKTVVIGKLPVLDTKSTLTQTIEMTWTVKRVESNGQAELTQTITRIRDQVDGTVGTYTYDSKDGKEPESLIAAAKIPVFKALLGAVVPFKMSPRGELVEVRDLLRWLIQGGFVFLGFSRYLVSRDDGTAKIVLDPGTELGIMGEHDESRFRTSVPLEELTPARRGLALACHGIALSTTRTGSEPHGICGDGVSKCRLCGSTPCWSDNTTLIRPAAPDADSRCPMLVFTDPISNGRSASRAAP